MDFDVYISKVFYGCHAMRGCSVVVSGCGDVSSTAVWCVLGNAVVGFNVSYLAFRKGSTQTSAFQLLSSETSKAPNKYID